MTNAVETFPSGVEFQVIDDTTNRYVAGQGSGDLMCITADGERFRADMFTGSDLPDDTSAESLIGKWFRAGHLSTALFFANEVTEIQPR